METRPPLFASKSTVAREMEISETTVDDYVRRGILPKPVKLTPGCVRWHWPAVEAAILSLQTSSVTVDGDPYAMGALNATEA